MALFQDQFHDLHGTEASDTAQRCETAAHTIATVPAGDSENKMSPDRIASLLSGLDEVTTCCETLSLNGTHVKADDLVMQLATSETIEDSRVVRQSTEATVKLMCHRQLCPHVHCYRQRHSLMRVQTHLSDRKSPIGYKRLINRLVIVTIAPW